MTSENRGPGQTTALQSREFWRFLHYLNATSSSSLESLQLRRLNEIANLRKQLQELFDRWVKAEVETHLARMLRQPTEAKSTGPIQLEFVFGAIPHAACTQLCQGLSSLSRVAKIRKREGRFVHPSTHGFLRAV